MRAGEVAVRTFRARRRQDAGAALRAIAKGGDRAVGLDLQGRRTLLLLDPELAGQLLAGSAASTVKGPGVQMTRGLLGDGLLTSEGDAHRRARRLVAPAFSPRRLADYATTFADCAAATSASWHDGQQVDMHREMAALTLAIVGRSLLGIDLATETSSVREGLESALSRFDSTGTRLPGFGRRGASAPQEQEDPARSAVHQLVDNVIAKRRQNLIADRGDVISALLSTESEPDGLTDAEIHDHVITLMMAGHETTANALTWTMHLLGQHPQVEARLHADLASLNGRAPNFEEAHHLDYTLAVVREAMRIYPAAWVVGRTATADLEFGGWQLAAGSVAVVSPLLLHHDARWFPEPELFDPDRWLDARAADVPRNAYLPFGTGPRSCIGEQFAWTEAVTVLAVLAARWTARTDPGHDVRMEYRVTLRPAGGLPMTLTERRT